jgi:hypothetical protein
MADGEKNDSNLANEVDAQLRGITRTNVPKNPKRVIRTFAADFAALSGGTPPQMSKKVPMTPAQPVVKPVPPKPVPARAPSAPPTSAWPAAAPASVPAPAPSREPIPLTRPAGYPPVKSDPNEGRIVSESIVASESRKPSFFSQLFGALFGSGAPKETSVRAPAAPAVWTPPSRPAAPVAPEPVSAPMPAPVQEESPDEREAVLARLRSRAVTPPAPPPVYPSPKPEPLPTPAPRPLPPPPAAAPTTAEPERLHTYAGDFNAQVNTSNASAFSVFAAQADAAPSTTTVITTKRTSGLTYVLITATLFVGGSLILFFAYRYFAGNQPVPIVMNSMPATLITPDDSTSISGSGTALMDALVTAANAPITLGNVRAVYLSVGTTTEPGGALLAALQLPAPDILLRNLKADSTVGIVHAGDETRAFMVLDADSYERVFAGMLAWEPTMANDLSPLYPPYPAAALDTGTTTATSTPLLIPGFTDEVVSSHDVRAYRDSTGRTVFLYGFADQNTLIIARDEQAFTLLLARLSASRS